MQAFFINVFIAVLTSDKVKAMLTELLGPLLDGVRNDIKAEITAVGDKLLHTVEQLPGQILGDASKDVGILLHEITGTKFDIAGAVKGEVSPLLPTVDSLQSMFENALKNIPGGGILGGFFGK